MQLNIPHLTDSVKHHCLTIVFLFSLSALAQGQSVDYAYDNAGNRTSRKVVSLAQTAPKKHTEDPAPVVDQLGERTVKVYPNPTKGALAVEITGGDEKDDLQILLFSAQGTQLQTLKAITGKTPVNMLAYPSGWYILRIVAGKEIKEMKIVKQ